MAAQTLFDKLWQRHLVDEVEDGTCLIYVDRHLVYEATSPQAFAGLRAAGRKPWRSSTVLATCDHNVPTTPRNVPIADPLSRKQVETLESNAREFGITMFGMTDPRQGIIHVIGPEQGATLPGMSVVAGDSHTSTHGAFGALAFGVGTSDVEHVLATQCLAVKRMKPMQVRIEGALARGVSAKDLILAVIGGIGTAGGTGCAIEFAGTTVSALSMEARMTMCNMVIEAVAATPRNAVAIDLPAQTITTHDGEVHAFAIDASRKNCLVNGLDDIRLTLEKAERIRAYERTRAAEEPWLFRA